MPGARANLPVESGPTTAIVGGRVVTPQGVFATTLLICDGRIASIGADGTGGADEVIDARGLVVLPGAIDPHVHLGDLGIAHRENFDAGTAAALLGGITCVFEHPLSVPATTTAARYRAKRAAVGPRARVDFGLWGAIVPGELDEIDGQWEAGARGFKAFVVDSGGIFPHVDDDDLREGMRRVAALGGLVLVHCENNAIVAGETARVRATGRRDGLAHAAGRPPIAELEATARVLLLARETGVQVQIVHVSEPGAAALVDAAVADGVRATLEHTMHHLTLDLTDANACGPWARCAPPLRSRESVEGLWGRLASGAPAQLACDHSPYARAEKLVGDGDIFAAGMGIQSLQESVPFFLDAALHDRGLDLVRCAELIAGQAARTVGLNPAKGAIAIGADADLGLWDLDSPWTVDAVTQHRSVNRWSPLDGRRCRVRLVRTILGGATGALDGEAIAQPGSGRFVIPGAAVSR
ncbi:MAG TPA: amidohydrolase family protein [Solirubrobacteraceae bacterium]|nr:amidohydrolase family protein [Solirubrobacteraceae bacterium]